jgi:hypothetical protein
MYELRIDGQAAGHFENAGEAESRARDIIRRDADSIVEIFDVSTGRPYAPAAGSGDKEDIARKMR